MKILKATHSPVRTVRKSSLTDAIDIRTVSLGAHFHFATLCIVDQAILGLQQDLALLSLFEDIVLHFCYFVAIVEANITKV